MLIVDEVREVYYPKYSPTREYYDQCRAPCGGYGGLLSITFWVTSDAMVFFDALATAKGPSLGTNFTLRWFLLVHSASRTDTFQLPFRAISPLRGA